MAINASTIFTAPSGISGYSGTSTSGYSGYSAYSGVSGYSGYSGYSGDSTSGYSGYSGPSGFSAIAGGPGSSGYSGYSGYSGDSTSGYSGYSGVSGYSGYSAYSGASGTSGTSGTSGYSGYSGYSGRSGAAGITQTNFIDNPYFFIWQHPVTSTDDTYTADRWYVLTQTAAVQSYAHTTASTKGGQAHRTNQIQAAAQRYMLCQILPQQTSKVLRSHPLALEFNTYQSSGGNLNMRAALLWWTGAADAVTSDVVNDWTSGTYTTGNFFNTTSLTLIKTANAPTTSHSWTYASMLATAGEVSTGLGNLIVCLWYEDALAQNVASYFADVNLTISTTALGTANFSPPQPAHDLGECQRYFITFGEGLAYSRVGNAYLDTTSTAGVQIQLPVAMRARPTVAYSAVGDWAIWNGATAITALNAIIVSGGETTTNLSLSTTQAGTTFTVGGFGMLISNNTVNAKLYGSADL